MDIPIQGCLVHLVMSAQKTQMGHNSTSPVADPAHDVLPRRVPGGVDVAGGDLHAPREHRQQDLPRPRGDRRHQEVCR